MAFRDIHISVEHPIDVVYSFGYKTRIGKLYKTGFHVYPGNSSDLESSLPFGNILKNLYMYYIKLHSTRSNSLQDIECKSWQLPQQTMQLKKMLENETPIRAE